MKCLRCGAELPDDAKFCSECQAPTRSAPEAEEAPKTEGKETGYEAQKPETERPSESSDGTAQPSGQQSPAAAPAPAGSDEKPNKKFLKILAIVIAIAAVFSIGALAYKKMTAKDPKEVVIAAFENAFPKDQVSPLEELFGLTEFADTSATADREGGLTLKLDSCSEEEVNAYAGSGLRLAGRNDVTNGKSDFNMGVIYSGMDLVNLNVYYGDETLMLNVPELSNRVFTIDLSEGLEDRIKNSPTIAPLLEESGVDVEGLFAYFSEQLEQSTSGDGAQEPFDLEALMERYREGCRAQDNFKEALTVEKAEKGTFTVDGKSYSCDGYSVLISKAAMIDFLRTSSDFFLQDETLKADFLNQLEATVKMSELMGTTFAGEQPKTAAELQQESYEQVEDAVDQMIGYLDEALNDVEMTVYVTKEGALAAVDGTTSLDIETEDETSTANVDFSLRLEGGAYPAQNMNGTVLLYDDESTVDVSFVKQGTYDGKSLTCDMSFDLNAEGEDDKLAVTAAYTGTYSSEDGAYHVALEGGSNGSQIFKVSMNGVIDELEKGKSFHADIDALEISAMDNAVNVVLSGEYYFRPLAEEILPLEGDTMDVLSATQEEWSAVGMEMLFGVIGLSGQLGAPLN